MRSEYRYEGTGGFCDILGRGYYILTPRRAFTLAVEAILPRLDRIASSPFRPFKIASGKQLGRLEILTGRTDLRVNMPSDVGFALPITRKPPRSVRRRQRKAEGDTADNAANGKENRASGRNRRSKNADKGNGGDPPTEVNVLLT